MNKSGKTLKLPKKLLQHQKVKQQQKEELQQNREPQTSDDFFISGTEEEEFGDRWFASDLSKALRFYQRAYTYYRTSLSIQTDNADARYNLSRLLFSVYTRYIKNEGVSLNELENCAEALSGDESGVVQPLSSIIKLFQDSVRMSAENKVFPWDLYYNAAICYFEYIEELNKTQDYNESLVEEIVQCLDEAQSLLSKVIGFQTSELEALVTAFQNESYGGPMEVDIQAEEAKSAKYINEEETVLPGTVLETCLSSYGLVTAVYESIFSEHHMKYIKEIVSPFILQVDAVSSSLVTNFSVATNELVPTLTKDELQEFKLAKVNFFASKCKNFSSLSEVWSSISQDDIPDSVDKLLMESSSYRTLIDNFNESSIQLLDSEKWDVLSLMNSKLKSAYNLLKIDYDTLKKERFNNNEKTSSIISQLCSILIERSDVELERSQLSIPDERTKTILLSNCKNLLKNSLTLSQQSGGLRESSSDKLIRQKRQKETLIRLCLLNGKTSESELDEILGPNYWPQELKEISELGIYDSLPVQALLQESL